MSVKTGNEPQNRDATDSEGTVRLLNRVLADTGQQENVLFVAPHASGISKRLHVNLLRARILHVDYSLFRADSSTGSAKDAAPTLYLGLGEMPAAGENVSLAVIFMPKAKRLAEHLLATIGETLAGGTPILLGGPKRSGIGSARKMLAQLIGPVTSSYSAHHAKVLCSRIESGDAPERRAILDRAERTYDVSAWGTAIQVATLPGVFSDGRLDDGTAFLLDHLPRPEVPARGLDWGCGAGVIGTLLQKTNPDKRVDLVDVSTIACEASRRTLELNGLSSRNVWPSDVMSDVDGTYDLIVANPPFHRVQTVDTSMTREFIRAAAQHLLASGRLVVVTNRFIDYFTPLRGCFHGVEVIAENARYRLIEACRPQRA
jgi:16S rRNA (guanine1207-N2)-methyltransferase